MFGGGLVVTISASVTQPSDSVHCLQAQVDTTTTTTAIPPLCEVCAEIGSLELTRTERVSAEACMFSLSLSLPLSLSCWGLRCLAHQATMLTVASSNVGFGEIPTSPRAGVQSRASTSKADSESVCWSFQGGIGQLACEGLLVAA